MSCIPLVIDRPIYISYSQQLRLSGERTKESTEHGKEPAEAEGHPLFGGCLDTQGKRLLPQNRSIGMLC